MAEGVGPFRTAVALGQGLWMRRRIEHLPPASGPFAGATGNGPGLRIAVLGESTAAGCGVRAHEEGFAGAVARRVAAEADAGVHWEVAGQHGATARRIRHRLMPRLSGDFDVVFVLAGANDVLSRRAPQDWAADMSAIVEHLGSVSRHVVVAGVPPFGMFPALPRTLAGYLAARGRMLDQETRRICARFDNVRFVETDAGLIGDGFFARDGFHPSARGYERWAEEVSSGLVLN